MGAALTLVGAALAGCSADPPPALPAGLTVSVVQQRGDIVPGRLQLRLTNDSDAAVIVVAATLTSAALSTPAEWAARRAESVAPGRVVDLPVALPALVCAAGEDAARVTLEVAAGGGTRSAEMDADDPLRVLDRLRATQCDREAVSAVAHVEATGIAPRGDGMADVSVSITPAGGDRISSLELVALRGTPLLRFATGDEAPLATTVRAGEAPSTLTVAVVPRRCDPHAIAEDKVGTLFDLVARVDGREVVVSLGRPQMVADALVTFAAEACGLSTGSAHAETASG
ncbi:hypothetical protein [Microbacterium sp.]|uniref:hypothetical protein n=1 Tax=Microbacterium sp. TaxID=51671 RepID=UPI0025F60B5E|nr:hypothetical protein [Microbacterium sp.]MBT9606746.1 hypothetical protein [Microbacterium sp.]